MTKRDIGQEILDGIQAIKEGKGNTYQIATELNPKHIREQLQLGHSAFAALFGVSPRTVRAWESGERKPTGAAKVLLLIAANQPELILETVRKQA